MHSLSLSNGSCFIFSYFPCFFEGASIDLFSPLLFPKNIPGEITLISSWLIDLKNERYKLEKNKLENRKNKYVYTVEEQ